MDGLIVILILIGIISASSNKKKQKAQKRAAQQQAPLSQVEKPSGQTKVPFTRDEWNAFLSDMEKQEKPKARPAKAVRAAKPLKTPAPVLHLDHDEPEGTVSTQGESAAEHAEHRKKLLEEEAHLREQHETLQELRHLNRQKLRRAVVMSEVLGRPVSLRPRGYR